MKKQIVVLLTILTYYSVSFAQQLSSSSWNHAIEAYLNLKNSLVSETPDSARIAAKKLFQTLGNIKTDSLSVKQKKAWIKYSEKLSYDAEHIKGTNDIEHQREHFMSLSKNLFLMLKEFDNNSLDLYYDFCPMADNGKGAFWVSETAKIQNPYLGSSMPTCGSVKDSLNVK